MKNEIFEPEVGRHYHNPEHDVCWYVQGVDILEYNRLFSKKKRTITTYTVVVVDKKTNYSMETMAASVSMFKDQEILVRYRR